MTKKILFLTLCFSLLFIEKAHAHVLEDNQTIGGVLHIDPNDDPIAGAQSTIFLDLKDTTSALQPDNCDCVFSVLNGKTVLYTQPLFQDTTNPSLENITLTYSFPTKGTYTLTVSGKPLQDDNFHPFTLTYEVQVQTEVTPTPQNTQQAGSRTMPPLQLLGIAGIIILAIIFVITKKRFFR